MIPWYYDIPKLMSETDKLYERGIAAKGWPNKLALTKKKIIEVREWAPALPYIEKNFDRVLKDLEYFYVPNGWAPGPMFVFPLRDLDGTFPRAQTKPLEGSAEFGKGKYWWMGEKTFSPSWLGNSQEMIQAVIDNQAVILMEGPFDLLGCRLVCPDLPILCPLTKSIGGKHEAFLRMLGVKTIFLLFDNELPTSEKYDIGQGNLSMRMLAKEIKTMKTEILLCPSSDPSECLKSSAKVRALKSLLSSLF